MKDLKLSDLSQSVRDFLSDIDPESGVVIRDDDGRTVVHLVPRHGSGPFPRDLAWNALESIGRHVGDRLRGQGVTSEEAEGVILDELLTSRNRPAPRT